MDGSTRQVMQYCARTMIPNVQLTYQQVLGGHVQSEPGNSLELHPHESKSTEARGRDAHGSFLKMRHDTGGIK